VPLVLQERYHIKYDPVHHRLRCTGHIINLVAQAFLFSTDKDALSEGNNRDITYLPTELEMENWRRQGPLGKLHNIVVHIQRSPQRMAAFLKLSSGKRLVRDNKTRWNSWFAMIDCAIQERMRLAVDLYCHQAGKEMQADSLSAEDWAVLTNIHHFLRFFHQATLATEGHAATLERVLSTMEFLLEQLETGKLEYSNDSYIGPCINSAWSKLDKYYGLTERSSVYIATMVLIPFQKWTWIEDNWAPDWIRTAKASVQDLWDSQYKPPYQPVIPTKPKQEKTEHQIWIEQKRRQPPIIDEYIKYCQASITPECDSKSWWMEPAQRATYPNLAIMALDMLSIPAMSDEPERLFSGAGVTITERRNRLGVESIEALECLKSWNRGGIPWADEN
jgi:hypothetical protein